MTPETAMLEWKLDKLLSMQERALAMQQAHFLTAAEFAKRTGLRVKLILDKCERMQLAHRKEGKSVLVPFSELERWLQEAQAQRIADEKCTTRRNRLIKAEV